jgi:hypothetical protein
VKTLRLLNELPAGGNKILYENFCTLRKGPWYGKKSDELDEMNDEVRPAKLTPCEIASEIGLHEAASQSPVLHA